MNSPDLKQIEAWHQKYAPDEASFERVFGHCQVVWRIAEQLLAKKPQPVDQELVRAGCLLHDIGVYPLFDQYGFMQIPRAEYIRHATVGAELLRKEGLPETLALIVERHTGVGITQKEVLENKLPIPAKDYLAETIEERLVMYADKFHSKGMSGGNRFNPLPEIKHELGQFGEEKVRRFEAFVTEFGQPDLDRVALWNNERVGTV